jgi:SAM-dependent methyltransferase
MLSPFLARQRYKHAARFVAGNDMVLDIGCGSGAFRKYLPKNATYFGADTVRHWDEADPHFFVTKVGQPLPGQLRKQRVSAVTALALIEHLSEPGQLFRDAGRVLPEGGRLILTTPHPLGRKVHDFGGKLGIFSSDASEEHEEFLDKRMMKRLAEREGFELVRYRRFLFWMNQVAVFEKTAS